MAHATQMAAADTALLVIDVQEKLLPKISDADRLLINLGFLIEGAKMLEMPVLATEQYPRGLGSTVSELLPHLPDRPEKTAFSSCAAPTIVETLHRNARPKVVLAGIEAHVCVLHTALDLLALDFRVYLAVDAIGARYPIDREIALRRLEHTGAILTTTEGCLFEWMGGADHPRFKEMSRLVQERMKRLS